MKYVSELKELETKKFDTIAELEKAEKEVAVKQKAKELKVAERKEDAVKVENAFKALNAEKKEHNETIVAARKTYNAALLKAKEEYNKAVTESNKKLTEKETSYQDALGEFTKKHPEGYHMTLKDGDTVTTISKSSNIITDNDFNKAASAMDDLLDAVFKTFLW